MPVIDPNKDNVFCKFAKFDYQKYEIIFLRRFLLIDRWLPVT